MARHASSYLQYLPLILAAEDDPSDPREFLGRFLCIFERILTGREEGDVEGAPLPPPIEAVINDLPRLFDPWRTDAKNLDWLATFVAADLLAEPTWDEYQRRKRIADAVDVHRQRWGKTGILTYLRYYALDRTRPRIVIDDGTALYRIDTSGRSPVAAVPLAAARPIAQQRSPPGPALLHPAAVAVEPRGTGEDFLIVADLGPLLSPTGSTNLKYVDRRPSLWRLRRDGGFADWRSTGLAQASDGPEPIPLSGEPDQNTTPPLRRPVAVLVETENSYLVLERGSPDPGVRQPPSLFRYSVRPPGAPTRTTLITNRTLGDWTMGMIRLEDGRLVILNGRDERPTDATVPQLIVVTVNGDTASVAPPVDLPGLRRPTGITLESGTSFLICDSKHDAPGGPALEPIDGFPQEVRRKLAGEIFRVTCTDSSLTQLVAAPEALLANAPLPPPTGQTHPSENPLITPTCILLERTGVVLISDMGTSDAAYAGRTEYRPLAVPPRLYRVDLTRPAPQFESLLADGTLVRPAHFVRSGDGEVIVADHGELGTDRPPTIPGRDWRNEEFAFGISVLFAAERPLNEHEARDRIGRIARVVREQSPAHMIYAIDF